MTTQSEIDEIRKQYELQPGETLEDKWRRESQARLADLRRLSNAAIEQELRDLGCDEEVVTVVSERMACGMVR